MNNNEHKIDTSTEAINTFLDGHNSFERLLNIECGYSDNQVTLIFKKEDGKKFVKKDDLKPFVWAKASACNRMFDGDKKALRIALKRAGIWVKKLYTTREEIDNKKKTETKDTLLSRMSRDRLVNGYKYMFYATKRMSYGEFMMFFQLAGVPIYKRKKKTDKEQSSGEKEYLAVSPIEQYMISTGIRMFKGYNNYNDLTRFIFDLETQGLNPRIHSIDQIGMWDNKGFKKILSVEGEGDARRKSELDAIDEFIRTIKELSPDVVIGYNSENFDWDFIIVRLEILGSSLEELCDKYGYREPIYKVKRQSVLKLGGEVEYYYPTRMWGTTIIDGLHAVRRAQAIDSNMKSANLKYVTKYSSLNKMNRVYVPGDKITSTWNVKTESYAFNDDDGTWYLVDENHPLKEGYKMTSGKYIVERYLLDDLYETDKVELRYNEANFLLCKILPTSFQRVSTMGTAGIWKLILLSWCYENNLGVPSFSTNKSFTGGLSRLLKVGYADNVLKLDYNSLYPSIILTWNISSELDISDAMITFLNYVLTQREKFKKMKKDAGKKIKELKAQFESEPNNTDLKMLIHEWESKENLYDKNQLVLKIVGNSFFGSYGCPSVFPFGDLTCAEKTTCIGRQSLRLMIHHFMTLGYTPIVGDSFTHDTPIFIKYNDTGMIDIKPISDVIDEKYIKVDALGREYDYSKKNYKVLCRSGWSDVEYIYRHKTNKPIYRVQDESGVKVDVTEDHSLFDKEKKEIKPSEITNNTKLEYYNNELKFNNVDVPTKRLELFAKMLYNGSIDSLPTDILNCKSECSIIFMEKYTNLCFSNNKFPKLGKVAQACMQFMSGK